MTHGARGKCVETISVLNNSHRCWLRKQTAQGTRCGGSTFKNMLVARDADPSPGNSKKGTGNGGRTERREGTRNEAGGERGGDEEAKEKWRGGGGRHASHTSAPGVCRVLHPFGSVVVLFPRLGKRENASLPKSRARGGGWGGGARFGGAGSTLPQFGSAWGPETRLPGQQRAARARVGAHLTFTWMRAEVGAGRSGCALRWRPRGRAIPAPRGEGRAGAPGARGPPFERPGLQDLPTAVGPAPLSLTFLPANGAAACHPQPAPRGRAGREVRGRGARGAGVE